MFLLTITQTQNTNLTIIVKIHREIRRWKMIVSETLVGK